MFIISYKLHTSISCYNTSQVVKDITLAHDSYTVVTEPSGERRNVFTIPARVGIETQTACISRSTRSVLAYLHTRFQRIRDLWWETGRAIPDELKQCLGATEATLIDLYDELISRYSAQVGIDLRSDQVPPKDLFVEVCATKDIGEIMTEHGPMKIRKGTRQLMRRTDCELLIREGSLEQIVKD